jgi:hypothetical protein
MVWDLWGSLILVISVCSRVSKDDAKIYDFRMWLLRCRRGRIWRQSEGLNICVCNTRTFNAEIRFLIQ